MSNRDAVVPSDRVESLILSIRGRRVILDSDLARLYGVTTARLNEQVKRNPDRFPPDFMFPLSRQEFTALISQNATSKLYYRYIVYIIFPQRKSPCIIHE